MGSARGKTDGFGGQARICGRRQEPAADPAAAQAGGESFEELLALARAWLASEEGRAASTRVEGDYRNARETLNRSLGTGKWLLTNSAGGGKSIEPQV